MGAHRTVRPCRQHLAPKMRQRASQDLQLIPLIAASVGELGVCSSKYCFIHTYPHWLGRRRTNSSNRESPLTSIPILRV